MRLLRVCRDLHSIREQMAGEYGFVVEFMDELNEKMATTYLAEAAGRIIGVVRLLERKPFQAERSLRDETHDERALRGACETNTREQ